MCKPSEQERLEGIRARNNEPEAVKVERARQSQELVDAVWEEYYKLKSTNTQRTENKQSEPKTSPSRSMNQGRGIPSVGYFKYEAEPTGFNKVCYYEVQGDIKAVNMNAASICPTTYDF